jgi:hypothetical protein
MTTPDSSKKAQQQDGGSPVQARLLVAVLVAGVVGLILKAFGVF